jgi:hypothetical protein
MPKITVFRISPELHWRRSEIVVINARNQYFEFFHSYNAEE